MAILNKDELNLWLAAPFSSTGNPMPDGTKPVQGGWSRIVFEIEDIEATVTRLKGNGMNIKHEQLQIWKTYCILNPNIWLKRFNTGHWTGNIGYRSVPTLEPCNISLRACGC